MPRKSPTAPDPGAPLALRADVSLTETDNGLVLLDERAGTYFQMNATGALVLRRLLAGAGQQEIVALLGERFAVDADRAAADVAALLERLRDTGLLATGARR